MKQNDVKHPPVAPDVLSRIDAQTPLGTLRAIAKEIRKDHPLAIELWSAGSYLPRLLAILIMDPKQMTQELVDALDLDIRTHDTAERRTLIDWLLANQLSKASQGVALIAGWEHSVSALQRRLFWYHQARLRWVGQTPPPNTEALLTAIEQRIVGEDPDVQWAMNFTAAQMGVFQPEFRDRCIALGERTGLYRDEAVAKNCTPDYLPAFIAAQLAKRKGQGNTAT